MLHHAKNLGTLTMCIFIYIFAFLCVICSLICNVICVTRMMILCLKKSVLFYVIVQQTVNLIAKLFRDNPVYYEMAVVCSFSPLLIYKVGEFTFRLPLFYTFTFLYSNNIVLKLHLH